MSATASARRKKPGPPRRFGVQVHAQVTDEQRAALEAIAHRDQLSVAGVVRRAVNQMLAEEGHDLTTAP